MKTKALQFTKLISKTTAATTLLVISSSIFAVDLSNNPLTTSTATAMRPNIMFVLDDSGSMASTYMPDYVDDGSCKNTDGSYTKQCLPMDPPYYASGFNSIYYNPTFTYPAPANADGTTKPNQVRMSGSTPRWDQVQTDPYTNPSSKISLETYQDIRWCIKKDPSPAQLTDPKYCRVNGIAYASMTNPLGGTHAAVLEGYNYPTTVFKYDRTDSGTRFTIDVAPYYYNVTPGAITWCKDTALSLCQASRTSTHKNPMLKEPPIVTSGTQPPPLFKRADITVAKCTPTCPGGRTYAAEMTNFANWYSYYRFRLNMMKTGVGRAFVGLDDNYRIGFMTISTTPTSTSRYLQIKTYDSTQKNDWFNKLYGITTLGGTPLRPALSTAGQMYAGKALVDPVQYSCQKNFTILSTDGFWNGGKGFKLDGSAIGNQDNNAASTPRPKYDGGLNSTTEAGGGVNGGKETLADIAMHFYKTDLRDATLSNCIGALGAGSDVCKNNVAPTKKDPASHQHMTLFTIGLGVDGELTFRPDYDTASTGDFTQIRSGSKNWPSPKNDDQTAIDDLWHAAVNGGGTYYSAKNPQALSDGLGDALREVGTRSGSAAAASTSNPQVTTKDNFVFSANYRTAFWDSTIRRRRINTSTGDLEKTIDWEASAILNTMVTASSDVRTIYMFDGSTANKLKSFQHSALTSTEKAHLDISTWPDPTLKLSSWAGLNPAGQSAALAPSALVNFLRGQTGLEDDSGDANLPFRGRETPLGDIVNSETVYSKKSPFQYTDAGHESFVNTTLTRQGLLFAAANDGMLHAINSDTGREMWAYVPTAVIPNLYELADKNYVHEFFVDGTPTVGDVFDGSSWRTIVVGGLNKGGKGFYALDVTNPTAPKALWEFCATGISCSRTDPNMGFSYGNPVITKLGSEWVVIFTSGYNNADGKGYLYVVDAITGAQKFAPLVTSCTGANCGLAKISPWIESYENNKTLRVYGGDLAGNLWRFDVANTIAPAGREAHKVAQFGNPLAGMVQSITTKPELSEVDGRAVILVGTGRFLGISDKVDTTVNSFYGVEDDLSTAELGTVRTNGKLVKQTLTPGVDKDGRNILTNSDLPVDWVVKDGWFVDFPNAGERSMTDPVLALGTVTLTTNLPTTADPCSGGGISWIYHLNWRSGGAVTTADQTESGEPIAAKFLANDFATRSIIVQLPNGKLVAITQTNQGDTVSADGKNIITDGMVAGEPFTKDFVNGRRAGWREIIDFSKGD
jgi:type IV pilus assembly protein PilY1